MGLVLLLATLEDKRAKLDVFPGPRNMGVAIGV
jgi:hypothetical protein